MYWDKDACPVCESGQGYVESMHGGIKPEAIENLRQELLDLKRELRRGNERLIF